jgi:hypothetical protein
MLKFVYNEDELKKFFDIVVPPLNNKEVYFTSLSARNKQLTEEERILYSLGRTEMFERKTIREKDWLKFKRTIYKYETSENAMTGREGMPLPSKCLIIYFNINPCDMVKAYRTFMDNMNENLFNLLSGGGSGDGYFKRIDRELMNAIQKSTGTRHYIDIDIDVKDKYTLPFKQFLEAFLQELKIKEVEYFVVETKNGYHILLKKESIHFNYNHLIDLARIDAADGILGIKEIEHNSNGMIPLPGCLQGDFPVKVKYELSNYIVDK